MADFSITLYGKPLSKDKYTIDFKTRVFSSMQSGLTLDFVDTSGCWTFITDSQCTFETGSGCTFRTGAGCTFKTDTSCSFNTGSQCTFDTSWECVFNVHSNCTFNTDEDCIFHTGDKCTFDTGRCCMFSILDINTHKFKSWDGVSIILDRTDDKRYILNKALIDMMKVANG